VAAQSSTDNLMDYRGNTELWHHQWKKIQNPERVWLAFAEEEEEGEWGAHGITWFGNRLWGLAPDVQEKEMEDVKTLFDHVYEKHADYLEKSGSADVNIELEKYQSWSVRKSSHSNIAKKVFENLKNSKTNFSLHDEGIYLEEYLLEEQPCHVAVYSKKSAIELTENIRISSYSALRNNKFVKAGYRDGKNYGLIVFYDATGNMQMAIQITGGEDAEWTISRWLNYLGMILPSEEQRNTDKSLSQKIVSMALSPYAMLMKIWGIEEKKDILLDVRWISQFSSEINGRNCHWCATGGGTLCCNGGTPCETCPKDSTIKCCPTACTDTLQTTACDSCTNQVICKTGICKSNNCCFQTALAMIEQFGLTTNRSQAVDIATLINSNSWKYQSDLQADVAKFEESITYIDETLAAGNPVLIGVHYKNTYSNPYNANKATFHYMVIVGKIHKNNREYYWFYDPGTRDELQGNSSNNLLEIDRSKNIIHGNYKGIPYTLKSATKSYK
jgi:hypothetical protein